MLLSYHFFGRVCDVCLFRVWLEKHGIEFNSYIAIAGFFSSIYYEVSRPFPSLKNPHFQNEAKCKTFVVKVSI